MSIFFFFSSRRRHTRLQGDWSSDVCSSDLVPIFPEASEGRQVAVTTVAALRPTPALRLEARWVHQRLTQDRKSTRLNSSHLVISYAVFCLKKKKRATNRHPSKRLLTP